MRGRMAVVVFSIWLFAAPAGAAETRQTYSDTFTTKLPGTSTGRDFAVDFVNPEDPEAKPPAIEHVFLELHPGAHFDTSAIAQCRASDAELIAIGAEACPEASRVGENVVVVDTGFPGDARFVTTDFVFFNNRDELILLGTIRDGGARVVLRGKIRDNTFEIDIPFLPGTPPDGGADKSERATFYERSSVEDGSERNYLTTPPRCPKSGYWTNRVTYTYRDGIKQTSESRSPCRRGKANDDGRDPGDDGRDGGQRGRDQVGQRGSDRFPRGGIEAGRAESFDSGADLRLGAGVAFSVLAAAGLLKLRRSA